jgi:hypothetical protein
MAKTPAEDPRLTRFAKICLALPEVTRQPFGEHATFRVRKKAFAYYLNNHHGDGIVGIWCKAPLGDNVDRIAAQPARYFMPPYVGHQGWVGLRLDTGDVDWDEVAELAIEAYRLAAPKRLVATLPR